jgi:hypothetical protein
MFLYLFLGVSIFYDPSFGICWGCVRHSLHPKISTFIIEIGIRSTASSKSKLILPTNPLIESLIRDFPESLCIKTLPIKGSWSYRFDKVLFGLANTLGVSVTPLILNIEPIRCGTFYRQSFYTKTFGKISYQRFYEGIRRKNQFRFRSCGRSYTDFDNKSTYFRMKTLTYTSSTNSERGIIKYRDSEEKINKHSIYALPRSLVNRKCSIKVERRKWSKV